MKQIKLKKPIQILIIIGTLLGGSSLSLLINRNSNYDEVIIHKTNLQEFADISTTERVQIYNQNTGKYDPTFKTTLDEDYLIPTSMYTTIETTTAYAEANPDIGWGRVSDTTTFDAYFQGSDSAISASVGGHAATIRYPSNVINIDNAIVDVSLKDRHSFWAWDGKWYEESRNLSLYAVGGGESIAYTDNVYGKDNMWGHEDISRGTSQISLVDAGSVAYVNIKPYGLDDSGLANDPDDGGSGDVYRAANDVITSITLREGAAIYWDAIDLSDTTVNIPKTTENFITLLKGNFEQLINITYEQLDLLLKQSLVFQDSSRNIINISSDLYSINFYEDINGSPSLVSPSSTVQTSTIQFNIEESGNTWAGLGYNGLYNETQMQTLVLPFMGWSYSSIDYQGVDSSQNYFGQDKIFSSGFSSYTNNSITMAYYANSDIDLSFTDWSIDTLNVDGDVIMHDGQKTITTQIIFNKQGDYQEIPLTVNYTNGFKISIDFIYDPFPSINDVETPVISNPYNEQIEILDQNILAHEKNNKMKLDNYYVSTGEEVQITIPEYIFKTIKSIEKTSISPIQSGGTGNIQITKTTNNLNPDPSLAKEITFSLKGEALIGFQINTYFGTSEKYWIAQTNYDSVKFLDDYDILFNEETMEYVLGTAWGDLSTTYYDFFASSQGMDLIKFMEDKKGIEEEQLKTYDAYFVSNYIIPNTQHIRDLSLITEFDTSALSAATLNIQEGDIKQNKMNAEYMKIINDEMWSLGYEQGSYEIVYVSPTNQKLYEDSIVSFKIISTIFSDTVGEFTITFSPDMIPDLPLWVYILIGSLAALTIIGIVIIVFIFYKNKNNGKMKA